MKKYLLAGFLFLVQLSGFAQTFFKANVTGPWNVGSNWASGSVPGAGVSVSIPATSTLQIPNGTTFTCASIAAGSAGTISSSGTGNLTVNGNIPATASTAINFTGSTGTITFGGDYASTGNFTAGSSTALFSKTGGSQIIKSPTTYYKLTKQGSSTATIAAGTTTTVSNTLTVTAGAITNSGTITGAHALVVNGGTLTSSGTASSSSTLDLSSGIINHTAGTFTISNASTITGGTLTTSGTSFTTASFGVGFSAGTINHTAGTFTVSGAATINGGTFNSSAALSLGSLTLSSGSLSHTSGAMSVTGTSLISGGTLTNSGTSFTSAALTLSSGSVSHTSGTMSISGATTVSGGTLTTTSGTSFTSASLNASAGTIEHNSSTGTFTVTGTIGISSTAIFNIKDVGVVSFGTLNMTGGTLNLGDFIAHAVVFPTIVTSYSLTGGTVDYNAKVAQNISARTYYNLSTGSVNSFHNTKTLLGNVIVSNNLSISSFTDLDASTYNITVTNDISGSIGAGLTFSTGTLFIGGNDYYNGTFTAGSGTVNYNSTSLVVSQSVSGRNYYNLTLSGASDKTLAGSDVIYISNDFITSGGAVNPNNGIVEFSGGAQSIRAFTFYNLVLSGSGDKTLIGNVFVNNYLEFASSVLLNTTSTEILTIGQNGYFTGTLSNSAHIVGPLRREFNASSSNDYPIGDGTNLLTVNITTHSVGASAGDYIEVSTTACSLASCYPTASAAFTNPAKVINRYWTFTNSGITSVNYDATVTYLTSDYTGITTSKLQFKAYNHGTSSFENLTILNPTSTSATATGVTIPVSPNAIDLFLGEGNPSTCVSLGSGPWTSASTWTSCDGTIPDGLDTVIISSGHTVTMDGNNGNAYALTINGFADWAANYTTNVGDGGIILNSSGDITGIFAGELETTGDFEMNKSSFSGQTIIEFRNGTSSNLKSSAGLTSYTINKLRVYSDITNSLSDLTVMTELEGTGIITQGANTSLTISSPIPTDMPIINASSTGNTVTYNVDGAQTIFPGSYYNLIVSTGTATVTKSIVDFSTYNVLSDLTLANGTGTVTLDLLSGTLNIGGNVSGSGILVANNGTSTVNYNGTSGNQNIKDIEYYNLSLSDVATKSFASGSYTVNQDLAYDVAGTATINSGAQFFFPGTSDQLVAALDFPYVEFSGAAIKTLSGGQTLASVSQSVLVGGGATLVTGGKLKLLSTSATNNACLLDSTAAGSGTVSGNIAVERYMPAKTDSKPNVNGPPFMVSSPVSGILLSAFQSTNKNFFEYIPTNAAGTRFSSVNVASSVTAGKGYLLRALAGAKFTLTGTPNTGDVAISINSGGDAFNLVGNPYPSNILWQHSYIDMTNVGASGVAKTINNNGVYEFINPGEIVAPGQGFFVQAATTGNLTFRNVSRLTGYNQFYRLESPDYSDLFKMVINQGKYYKDESMIWAQDNALSTKYNTKYDGNKLMPNSNIPAVYMLKEAKNLDLFTFNKSENNVTIPVRLRLPIDTTYFFSFEGLDKVNPNCNVYLLDSVQNVKQDLRSNPKYTFTAKAGVNSGFKIVFNQTVITTGVDDKQAGNGISVYSDKGVVYFNLEEIPSNVTINDISGKRVYQSSSFSEKTFSVDLSESTTGIYIATVETNGKIINKKVILNR